MSRGTTGDATDYDTNDDAAAEAACEEAWAEWESEQPSGGYSPSSASAGPVGGSGGSEPGSFGPISSGRAGSGGPGGGGASLPPTTLRVRANVEWAGEQRGVRSVSLDGLDLAELERATARAAAARAKASAARPLSTYRATDWSAQLRRLESTQAGRGALSRAGFDASARTRRRWRAGTGGASKARRNQIEEAYLALRNGPILKASAAAAAANKELTDTLSDTLRDRYGTEIRLFDIESIEIGH
jgi:hypothetical protein